MEPAVGRAFLPVPIPRSVAPCGLDRQECLSYTFNKTGRWFSVRNHHDLLHLFALRLQHAARQPESLGGVGVIWPNLSGREFCQRQLFRGVMEEHNLERVARILRANQMRQRQSNFLRRRKTILAIENHRMRTVEHHHRCTRRLIVTLMNVQIAVLEIERDG